MKGIKNVDALRWIFSFFVIYTFCCMRWLFLDHFCFCLASVLESMIIVGSVTFIKGQLYHCVLFFLVIWASKQNFLQIFESTLIWESWQWYFSLFFSIEVFTCTNQARWCKSGENQSENDSFCRNCIVTFFIWNSFLWALWCVWPTFNNWVSICFCCCAHCDKIA